MSDPCSPVVRGDMDSRKSQVVDEGAKVLRCGAFIESCLRFGRGLAVPPQIRCDQSLVIGEGGNDMSPASRGLWPAVKEHHGLRGVAGSRECQFYLIEFEELGCWTIRHVSFPCCAPPGCIRP